MRRVGLNVDIEISSSTRWRTPTPRGSLAPAHQFSRCDRNGRTGRNGEQLTVRRQPWESALFETHARTPLHPSTERIRPGANWGSGTGCMQTFRRAMQGVVWCRQGLQPRTGAKLGHSKQRVQISEASEAFRGPRFSIGPSSL